MNTRLAFAFLLTACGGAEPSPSPPHCTPGAQVACACVGGGQGAQVCDAAGAFGTCICPDAGVSSMDAASQSDASGNVPPDTADDRGSVDVMDARLEDRPLMDTVPPDVPPDTGCPPGFGACDPGMPMRCFDLSRGVRLPSGNVGACGNCNNTCATGDVCVNGRCGH